MHAGALRVAGESGYQSGSRGQTMRNNGGETWIKDRVSEWIQRAENGAESSLQNLKVT